MQQLTDIVVIESLPLAACPAHTVFPALWTLSSSVHVLQAVPNTFKSLQGLGVSMCESPLYKLWISAGRNKGIYDNSVTGIKNRGQMVLITGYSETRQTT